MSDPRYRCPVCRQSVDAVGTRTPMLSLHCMEMGDRCPGSNLPAALAYPVSAEETPPEYGPASGNIWTRVP
jgi:hypothetical protein